MKKNRIIDTVAKNFNTTPKDVETEIKMAITQAGYDMEVSEFIAMARKMVIKKMEENAQ